MKTSVAIVDDHELMAKTLSRVIQKYEEYEVLFEASGGNDLIDRVKAGAVPDIVLLDISMPDMDGYETVQWLKNNYPEIRIIALSMNDKEESVIRMLRNGAAGYLLKGCKTQELKEALDSVTKKGFYYTEFVTSQLIKSLHPEAIQDPIEIMNLTEQEARFIKLSCSDFTYTEIGVQMQIDSSGFEVLRDAVFKKLNVKSRVGMVLEAIRLKLVEL